ncbi:MAG: YggS family pyridoxal phosphate-dependent enzyme [SAR86 cluster bacterium]|uniref:Pyridoxal phosphate homeostasis protein n=1 Tax=SAR86 cluster bacterium TaxID=2030880 RepID=A0A2A5CIH7_9GAMM|nr:MAG: YggS family pyridoxal phosphate-dependent enzyme [SAR86 cluster bacterium]
MSASIPEKIREVRRQISRFEKIYQRSADSVKLLAVSKTHPYQSIIQAIDCGQMAFGESYVQEALDKISALKEHDLEWHFIGPIQSNKTKALAENFDWVHSVDRSKIARRLSEQRPINLAPLKILLQVNLDAEANKAGVTLSDIEKLANEIKGLANIELAGLMTIPAPGKDPDSQRVGFRLLAQARDRLLAQGISTCQHLSMGMSNDFEAAIAEGSTIVRIGTDIFGARN